MIAAIYATGPNGEFGLNGKLPWGSFKEELDTFYATLDTLEPENLIVGAGTWLSLPTQLRERMLGDADLFIFADKPLPASVGLATPISHIGETFPAFLREEQTVVLGGANLLKHMYFNGHIDFAFVSTINSATPLSADITLDPVIIEYNKQATRLVYATGENADKSLSFVQELVTY